MIAVRLFLFFVLAYAFGAIAAQGQSLPDAQKTLKVPPQTMAARLLTSATPESPKMEKCSSRMVTLDVVVGEDGRIKSVHVLAGFEQFKESAIAAVKQWTYKPYLENELPMAVETTVLVYYPTVGKPGPLIIPDGKGGVKGADFLPPPAECKSSMKIETPHSQ